MITNKKVGCEVEKTVAGGKPSTEADDSGAPRLLADHCLSQSHLETEVMTAKHWRCACSKLKRPFILFLVVIVPVMVAVKVQTLLPFLVEVFGDDGSSEGYVVSSYVMELFTKYDENKDMMLSPREFQLAFHAIKNNNLNHVAHSSQEIESLDGAMRHEIINRNFTKDEAIVTLKASFQPLIITTMGKFKNEGGRMDGETWFHLHGLKNWQHVNIERANFSVEDFRVLMPPSNTFQVGDTWELVKVALGGARESATHLSNQRYRPPEPADAKESILLRLLYMFHERPFLHMRFPPRGGVACLRAENMDHYDIMFRLHPEFQLNAPPFLPFWFTPASFIGRLVMRKDGSHVEYFKMSVPVKSKLNVDMEWLTGKDVYANTTEGSSSSQGSYGSEVDIGFMPEMSVESTQPSVANETFHQNSTSFSLDSLQWTSEISEEKSSGILEKAFYPFKEVTYFPFNKTFDMAKTEGKLIHHILLWGSLDDQSC